MCTQIIIKIFFVLFNIRMRNLSFDELRLIAQLRNKSEYEEDLIKALSEPKPETKPETPKGKPKTPKPKPEPKIGVKTEKRKLKKS